VSRQFAASSRKNIPQGSDEPTGPIPSIIGIILGGITLYGAYHLFLPAVHSAKQAKDRFKRWRALATSPDYDNLGPREIRLLVVSPGQRADPVTCRLHRANLEDNPEFEALSYVWGTEGNTRTITCSGKPCRVTPNLHDALRNLRFPDRERVLWVDALCINQNSPREKGAQIPLMSSIYGKASQVLIWLGEATELSGDGLPTVRQLNAYLEANIPAYSGSVEARLGMISLRRLLPSVGALNPQQAAWVAALNWPAINALLGHAWFRRVWVYQEFAMASKATVFVGQDSMPLKTLLRPFSHLAQQPLYRQMAPLRPDAHAALIAFGEFILFFDEGTAGRRTRWSLLDLVGIGCLRQATDPRDRIYAFADLARDVGPGDWEVMPDYTASVEEVYRRFVRWCLLRNGNLEVLRFCNQDRTPGRRLPSWVPDWQCSLLMAIHRVGSEASPGSEPWVSWRPDEPDVLQIKGAIIDRIEQVSITRIHLMLLESFENRLGVKMDSSKGSKWYRKWRDAGLVKLANASRPDDWAPSEGLAEVFKEADAARQRFGSAAVPKHEMVNVVWMENCKHIASGGTGRFSPDQLDAFWRTMMSQANSTGRSSKSAFCSYMKILDDVRLGNRTTTRLPHLSPLHDWLASRHTGSAQAAQMRLGAGGRRSNMKQDDEDRLRAEMHNHWGLLVHNRFCSTQHGRFGWVPRAAKPGDVVCVFDGLKVPFVLRRKEREEPAESVFGRLHRYLRAVGGTAEPKSAGDLSQPTRYEVVGQCYIQGSMDGEWDKGGSAQRQVLELC
jgi:hypothetical protein